MTKLFDRGLWLVLVLAVSLLGCGGSSDDADTTPSEPERVTISADEALQFATDALVSDGISTDGLTATPTQIFGEWQVSFVPEGSDTLLGGYLVALNDETGAVLEVIPYR